MFDTSYRALTIYASYGNKFPNAGELAEHNRTEQARTEENRREVYRVECIIQHMGIANNNNNIINNAWRMLVYNKYIRMYKNIIASYISVGR